MLGDLYIGSDNYEDLEAFASRLFALLDVPSFEVRNSDNYFGGTYVLAKSLRLGIRLSLADNSEFSDYNFFLTFSPPPEQWKADRTSLDGLADLLARSLALEGFRIARPLGGDRVGEPKMFYRKRADGTTDSDGPIEVWRE
jgi:hypothetical protein